MSPSKIPFNRPSIVGDEMRYVAEALERGHLSGDGEFTKRCHALLERELGAAKVLLTTSCTHALELAALLLDLQPGDEVILPSFTFVSTANAFALRGAVPVFADIRRDTLNLDETQVEALVTERTRAILPVHYAGVGCEMGALVTIAERHGLEIVEDNAHGLFGRRGGKLLGSFGGLSTLSFHETKNITCGEGGALVINHERLVARAEILREKGTNRSQFFRGQVDKYTWVDLGSSWLPSDMLAAFLFGQLEARARIQARRSALWHRYQEELAAWALAGDVALPHVPHDASHPSHLFFMLMPSLEIRQRLIAHLRELGILAVFHYQALDSSPQGRKLGRAPLGCPVTAEMSDRLLRLPLYFAMTDEEQDRVLDAVRSFVVA